MLGQEFQPMLVRSGIPAADPHFEDELCHLRGNFHGAALDRIASAMALIVARNTHPAVILGRLPGRAISCLAGPAVKY
jgi:hypothetical protein